jgi:hypothetical protein
LRIDIEPEVLMNVTSGASLIRRLSWTERLFWLLDQNSPRHFVMAAQVDGHTSVDQWRAALDAVQRRHPLLSAGIEVGDDGNPHFYRVAAAPIPLRVLRGGMLGYELEAELAFELGLPFDPRRAPLMRAVLLYEPERATCILSTHHSIADGRSIAFVFRDLLQALTRTPLQALPVPPTVDEVVERVAPDRPRQAGPTALDAVAPGRPARYRARDGARPQVRTLQLVPGLVDRLRHRAREEGTSLHGALCSGLALSFAELMDRPAHQPVRIWSPMDVRKLLDLGDDCAVLAVSAIIPAVPDGLRGFWPAARGITSRLAETNTVEYLADGLKLLSQSIGALDVPAAAQLMAQRFAFDFVVTNLGVLPYETRFGNLCLEALWGPAVLSGFENEHVFGVTTAGGRLALSYSSYTPMDPLLVLFEQHLCAACALEA